MIDLPAGKDAKQWHQLGEYLAGNESRLLSEDEQARLKADFDDITRQEELIDDAILIGLVGGTGVGKSTFINALAGEKVSRSGDRRPTTDRVVVYRHVDTDLPDDVPTSDFAQPLVLHKNNDLTKVILFDFPDFDSAERKHTHILQKYLEYLDVLLIVVDDVKYADRRLYTLLSGLDHDPSNLFVLLNKTDRLAGRYREDTDRVIGELLSDVREKMRANANLDLKQEQIYPISAGAVLESRLNDTQMPEADRFQKVESLLGGYQADKYRLQVREKNIDARKQQLAEFLRTTALSEENRSILNETDSMLQSWRTDLKTSLAATPRELLTEGERRSLRRARLRRAGPKWGLPFSLVFSLLIDMPWSRKAGDALQPDQLGGRIHQHYRGFFEATKNLMSRFQSEFTGSQIADENQLADISKSDALKTSPEQWSAEMATNVQARIHDEEDEKKRRRWPFHLPVIFVLGMAVWNKVYPLIQATTGTGESGFFVSLGKGLVGAANPMFLIGLLVACIFVYVLTGLFLWMRETQKLDGKIESAESAIRKDVEAKGQEVIAGLEGNVERLAEEFANVEKLLPV